MQEFLLTVKLTYFEKKIMALFRIEFTVKFCFHCGEKEMT